MSALSERKGKLSTKKRTTPIQMPTKRGKRLRENRSEEGEKEAHFLVLTYSTESHRETKREKERRREVGSS